MPGPDLLLLQHSSAPQGVCHPRGSCAQDRALPVGDADGWHEAAQRAPRGGQLQQVPAGRAGSARAVKEVTTCLHRDLRGKNNKYSMFHTKSGACCPLKQHTSLFPHFSCLSPSRSTWFRNYRPRAPSLTETPQRQLSSSHQRRRGGSSNASTKEGRRQRGQEPITH